MDNERNYHIFYRMLAGMKAEEKRTLKLTRAEDYYYLTQGGSTTCPGMDDAEEFAIIRGAMKVCRKSQFLCTYASKYHDKVSRL